METVSAKLFRCAVVQDYWLSRLRVYSARLAEESYRVPLIEAGREVCNVCGARTADRHDPLVHANECPVGQVLHSLAQLHKLENEAPSPTSPTPAAAHRDRLPAMESEVCRLIFDARHLARELVLDYCGSTSCMLCGHVVSRDGATGHAATCSAGRVLRRLERMGDLAEAAVPAAAAGTAAGIRNDCPAPSSDPGCALPGCAEGGAR